MQTFTSDTPHRPNTPKVSWRPYGKLLEFDFSKKNFSYFYFHPLGPWGASHQKSLKIGRHRYPIFAGYLLGKFRNSKILAGVLDPGLSGSGPDPKIGTFFLIYLLTGFRDRELCNTFSETGGRGEQNVGFGILIFDPQPEISGQERF